MLSFWDRASQYLAQPICVFQRAMTFELKHCVLSLLVWFTFKTLCGSFMVKCIALPEDCSFCAGCLVFCVQGRWQQHVFSKALPRTAACARAAWRSVWGALAAACLQCIICLCFWKESLRWLGVRKHIWLLSFVAHDFCQGRKKDKKLRTKTVFIHSVLLFLWLV